MVKSNMFAGTAVDTDGKFIPLIRWCKEEYKHRRTGSFTLNSHSFTRRYTAYKVARYFVDKLKAHNLDPENIYLV